MCYLWLQYSQSLQHIALLTNAGIHVVMYFYYFLTTLGIRPAWKVLVTNGQIVQFVFSFACSVPFVWTHGGALLPCALVRRFKPLTTNVCTVCVCMCVYDVCLHVCTSMSARLCHQCLHMNKSPRVCIYTIERERERERERECYRFRLFESREN